MGGSGINRPREQRGGQKDVELDGGWGTGSPTGTYVGWASKQGTRCLTI